MASERDGIAASTGHLRSRISPRSHMRKYSRNVRITAIAATWPMSSQLGAIVVLMMSAAS
jgi:hypothetical protein